MRVVGLVPALSARVSQGTGETPARVTTGQVVEAIQRVLKPARPFEFWESDEEFYKVAAKTPRSNCIMDVSKLLAAGIKIRSVEEALEDSLRNWHPESR